MNVASMRLLPALATWCLFGASERARAFEPSDFARPRIVVPALKKAPPVAPALDAECWTRAAKVFGFVQHKTGRPATFATDVYLARTSTSLFFGFRCHAPKGTKPVTEVAHRDGPVYRDDAIEIYLVPPRLEARQERYQFLVSARNVQCDLYGADVGWNGQWRSAARVVGDGWIAVVEIPFRTIGLAAPPPQMRFSLSRIAVAPRSEASVFPWSGKQWYYNGAKLAGTLLFGESLPAVALTRRSDFATGRISLEARAVSLPRGGIAQSTLTVVAPKGKVVARDTQQPRFDSRRVIHELRGIPDGTFKMRYTFGRAGKAAVPAYYGGGVAAGRKGEDDSVVIEFPLLVSKRPDIVATVKLRDRGETLLCALQPRGRIQVGLDASYVFTVLDGAGRKLVAKLGTMPYRRGKAEVRRKLGNVSPRTRYTLRVALAAGGRTIAAKTVRFATPPAPEWLENRDGLPDGVPAPWTPVVLADRTVRVWGRVYEFARGPAPSQVHSGGRALLQAPCRLVLDPAPKEWALLGAKTEGPTHAPTAAVLDWRSRGGPVRYTARTRVEFDGTVRVDLTAPRSAKVVRYALEIPYKRALAKFVHRGPVRFGGFFTTYWLPKAAQTHGIIPNYYFLDDHGGLCWFNGMPFDWRLREPARALEFIPDRDTAILRVNYIDDGQVYDIDRTFTFGLQAMPARPMPETSRGLRSTHQYKYGFEDASKHPAWFSTVDYWADGNVHREKGSAELWVKADFHPDAHKHVEPFLTISHGRPYRLVLAWEPDGRGITARLVDAWRTRAALSSKIDLSRRKWTHVAVTWGDRLTLYVDGKAVSATAPLKGTVRVDFVNVYAGGKNVFVDGLRISRIPRTSFDLSKPPALDEYTLLLDNFDRTGWVNGRRATLPEKVSDVAEAGYLSEDAHLTRGKWGRSVDSMKAPVKSLLAGYAHLGIKQVMFHARQYTDEACAGLYIKDEAKFRKAVNAIHALGMDVILYVNNSLSNWDRMWDAYADDMLIEPRGTPFIQSWIPGEKTYQACPYSEYLQYFFWRLGRLMDDYKVDGFFLDGRMYATCRNTRHGCGTTNFEGQFVAKRDIWRGRLNQWRMYNVIKRRGGYAEQHKSSQWDAPTCFFWDGVWEGEQLMGQKLRGRKRLVVMPLVAMRAQMNGYPYGMPCRNEAHAYSPFRPIELCTYSFVHGTEWAATYRIDEMLVLRPYWKAKDEFGATLRNFVGYWDDRPPARSTPDALVKISAHLRPGKALIIVANFNEDRPRVEGPVTLDLKRLGLTRPQARDAFSGAPVPLRNGDTLDVSIKSFRQAWFVLE